MNAEHVFLTTRITHDQIARIRIVTEHGGRLVAAIDTKCGDLHRQDEASARMVLEAFARDRASAIGRWTVTDQAAVVELCEAVREVLARMDAADPLLDRVQLALARVESEEPSDRCPWCGIVDPLHLRPYAGEVRCASCRPASAESVVRA